MALSPQLLRSSSARDKGALYYLADEDALYNPRLHRRYAVREGIPVMLHRRGRDRRRRRARAAAGQGRGRRAWPSPSTDAVEPGVDRPTLDRLDTLGMWDVTFGLADQLAAAAAAVADADRRAARRRRHRPRRRARAWVAAASPETCWPPWPARPARCPSSSSRTRGCPAFVGRALAGRRAVVLGRRRPRPSPARRRRSSGARPWFGVGRRAAGRAGCEDVAAWPWPSTAPSRCPGPPSARCVAPSLAVAEDVGRAPGRPRAARRGRRAAPPARARRWPDRGNAAAELARTIGRTWPLVYGAGASAPWPPAAGRTRSTRTPRRRPSPHRCPRSATTSCAVGPAR